MMHRRASPAWWTLWKGTKKCGGGRGLLLPGLIALGLPM